MRSSLHKAVLLFATAAFFYKPAHAQLGAQFNKPFSALIPMQTTAAFDAWQPIAKIMGIRLPDPRTPEGKLKFYKGGTYYVLQLSPQIRFAFDALTGDVSVQDSTYLKFMQVKDIIVESKVWLPEFELAALAMDAKQLYPDPKLLNQHKFNFDIQLRPNTNGIDPKTGMDVDLIGEANAANAIFWHITSEGTKTLNECFIRVMRDKKKLSKIEYTYRPQMISALPIYGREDALTLARWLVAAEQRMPVPLKLSYQFSPEQKKYLGAYNYEEPYPVMEEDIWLHQRLIWHFQFEFTNIKLDANTGLPVGDFFPAPTKITDEEIKLFGLPHSIAIPQPAKLPLKPTNLEFASVNFNGDELMDVDTELHYAPIIRDNSPLIYADYFPKFLIAVQTKDEEVTLEGQLKEKHKAVIKIGEKKYILDGKEAEFATPPTRIDGRIYLPAELLQKLNGVLIRWEPKKKLLWVDTRYLRR